ncbi:MAG: hypothetical protein AB1298_07405 [Bacteroidota bacterium]
MNTRPITNRSKKLEWLKHAQKSQPPVEPKEAKASALTFVSDFISPVDQIPTDDHLLLKTHVEEKRRRPLSYTSENWIG